MSLWEDICKLGEANGRVRLRQTIEHLENVDAAIAAGVADKLNGAKGAEFEARSKKAKAAQQTGKNPLGGTASLAQLKRALTTSRNTLLRKHGATLAKAAALFVELSITESQLADVERAREETEEPKKSKQKSGNKQERAFLDSLLASGCTMWQLHQLSAPDLAYIAAFVREKAADPHHRKPDGIAAAAYRAGFLDLSIEGANADEQLALLLATDFVTDADLQAKKELEAAIGRPLDISPSLAGAIERAAEIYRIDGVWPGAAHTIDHAQEAQVERDVRTILTMLGIEGDEGRDRAWKIVAATSPTFEPDEAIDHRTSQVAEPGYIETARVMLDHVHGVEIDRWERLMENIGDDILDRQAAIVRLRPSAEGSRLAREDWEAVVLAQDWRNVLKVAQDKDVQELADLLQARSEVRWLASMRHIDLPASAAIEPPFLRTAQLLCQPVEEIIWELFDSPPQPEAHKAPPSTEPSHHFHRGTSAINDDFDY